MWSIDTCHESCLNLGNNFTNFLKYAFSKIAKWCIFLFTMILYWFTLLLTVLAYPCSSEDPR